MPSVTVQRGAPLRLRLELSDSPNASKIINLDTGQAITNVIGLTYETEAGQMPVLTLKLYALDSEIVIMADGDSRTGQQTEINIVNMKAD
jgi:hypothetical protein